MKGPPGAGALAASCLLTPRWLPVSRGHQRGPAGDRWPADSPPGTLPLRGKRSPHPQVTTQATCTFESLQKTLKKRETEVFPFQTKNALETWGPRVLSPDYMSSDQLPGVSPLRPDSPTWRSGGPVSPRPSLYPGGRMAKGTLPPWETPRRETPECGRRLALPSGAPSPGGCYLCGVGVCSQLRLHLRVFGLS